MGFDISCFDDKDCKKEVAYLRRSAWSETIHEFLEIMGLSYFDGGVSGNGFTIVKQKESIKESLEELKQSAIAEDDKNDYIEFVKDCINKSSGDSIILGLY